MSENLSQTFLALTRNSTDLEWLQGALAPLGQVVGAGPGSSLDELLALVDVTFAGLIFVGLDRDKVVKLASMVEISASGIFLLLVTISFIYLA